MEVTETPQTRPPAAASLWERADELLRRPWFAYASLALLQLVAVWGMWNLRDLTAGDTAWYFVDARRWHDRFADNIAWSPLYTTFYGSLLFVVSDVFAATILHRLIIIFTATTLVLAVTRRLLPAPVAWLVSAWWAVLPINFNTLYEVHLFGVIPVLACWWLLAVRDGPWIRGAALGVLAAGAVFVRNELSVAVLLLAAVCLRKEWVALRAAGTVSRARRAATAVTAYALPLAAVVLLTGFFYRQSISRFNPSPDRVDLREVLRIKHELNMAQVYAFGYQQRHPEWQHNPWTEHRELMTRQFGKAELPLSAMARANPLAVLEHVVWNFSLVPNGLQVLLFNATSGRVNPDYPVVALRSERALLCTIAAGLVWGAGTVLLFRNRFAVLKERIRGRETVWLAMLCVAAVAVPVIATQRPRPSYLFPLGILIMTFTGLCLTAIASRVPALRRGAGLVPLVVFVGYLTAPMHPYLSGRRPLLETIRRLEPYQTLIGRPDTRFLKGEFAFETMSFLGGEKGTSSDYGLLSERPAGVPLDAFLEQRGFNLVYLDEKHLRQLEADQFDSAKAASMPTWSNWKLLGCGNMPCDRWRLYELKPTVP